METRLYLFQYLLFDRRVASRNTHGVIERNCLDFQKVFDALLNVGFLFKVGQIDQ